ncbi:tripartite tricarboxylate transporter TctB family protein [Roseibacterium beibuensis]|uniref:Tripartite tricarboxylate transporter TctB family protein n=1 Tax=[Roseibacterium] beibuensis TaxID=1193142 RepID=A0ABP9L989_9RHOB|nr:tripartite tricarboxylate transporter TctB family protein [Roseibacterium beibuensis]MCS6623929.1 tripartite tricarboxylate transporter TctB family protein [Roseibacterium beibuensis]
MKVAKTIAPGLGIMALGLAFLWFGRGYPVGTMRSMGPGMFPMALASLAIGTGALIVLSDFLRGGEQDLEFRWRGVFAVLGALICFAFLLERAGLLITGLLAVVILAIGEGRVRPLEATIVGLVLSVAIWAVFGRGLGMPVDLFPRGV